MSNLYPTYIVDDELQVRSAICFMLVAAGAEARSFASGPEFLATLPDLSPGCVLADVRMPGQDGLELLREVRANGVEWPVLMMTGHGDASIAAKTMQAGALDLLQKPFDEELLLTCLKNATTFLDGLLSAA